MTKHRSKRAAKAKAKAAPSDARLIQKCVVYAQEIAAFHAGFRADPDCDGKYAVGPLGVRHENCAQQALKDIAAMSASTAAGLQAKARILPIVVDDCDGSFMDDTAAAFYRSFAADVKLFLEPELHSAWLAENASKREAGAPHV